VFEMTRLELLLEVFHRQDVHDSAGHANPLRLPPSSNAKGEPVVALTTIYKLQLAYRVISTNFVLGTVHVMVAFQAEYIVSISCGDQN